MRLYWDFFNKKQISTFLCTVKIPTWHTVEVRMYVYILHLRRIHNLNYGIQEHKIPHRLTFRSVRHVGMNRKRGNGVLENS